MQSTTEHAETIRLAIEEKPAWIHGTCKISTEDARVAYNCSAGNGQASLVNLASASPEGLQKLSSTCQPATFGVNQQNVLDESYRKAGKIDVNDFLTSLNPFTYGITERIRKHLLDASHQEQSLRPELYKLNVYDTGSFFKAHKDTPRGEGMIGSLVVAFSTPHEGGVLILRHQGKEYQLDSGSLLKDKQEPHISYAAFFSDVEHEVTPVTSGFRITLTWNLYLDDHDLSPPSPLALPAQNTLTSAISTLLKDSSFMPQGGLLGFGLDFQYPVKSDPVNPTKLKEISGRLKGSDAGLLQSLKAAGLRAHLRVAYGGVYEGEDYYYYGGEEDQGDQRRVTDAEVLVIAPDLVNLRRRYREDPVLECFTQQKAKITYPFDVARPRGCNDKNSTPIMWITTPKSTSRFSTAYLAYGNEASLGFVYADLVLVAEVPTAAKRMPSS